MGISSQPIALILLLQLAACHSSHYLITTSSSYRLGETKIFEAEIFGNQPCDVNLTIYRTQNGKQNVFDKVYQRISPGKRVQIPVKMPKSEQFHSLTLGGNICGKNTTTKSLYRPWKRSDIVFIQTDKPIYKPGDKIRMRVVTLDSDLKPTGKQLTYVIVEEPSGTRIMQWNNVELKDGLASLELPLTAQPVLGKWKIVVKFGSTEKKQVIEVAKYVLPKFQVQIIPPSYMALDMATMEAKICARYTYGKPVKGGMDVSICFKHNFYDGQSRRRKNIKTCMNITKEIDGCTDITMTRDELGLQDVRSTWSARLEIDASVTEKLTGIRLSKKATKYQIERRSYRLSFDGTPSKFRPGMPFKYSLKVTRLDGTPANNVEVKVVGNRGYSNVFYNKTFAVKNGLVEETLQLEHSAKSISLEATLVTKNPFNTSFVYKYPLSATTYINALYSPSLSYIKITKQAEKEAKIGSIADLNIMYTVRNGTGKTVDFYYNVYCSGKLMHSGVKTQNHPYVVPITPKPTTTPLPTTTPKPTTTQSSNTTDNNTLSGNVTVPELKPIPIYWPPYREVVPSLAPLTKPVLETFNIQFPVTEDMSPMCRILVYYVRSDKETVADSMIYDVESVLAHKVSVSFAEKQRKPGEKTKLIIKASPGSRVAFTAVDKSVHILRQGNEITKKKLAPYLKKYDTGSAWNSDPRNCYGGGYPYYPFGRIDKRGIIGPWIPSSNAEDASKAFNAAGVIFFSNLNIFTKPCQPPMPVALSLHSEVPENDAVLDRSGSPGPKGSTSSRKKLKKEKKVVRTRKDFPETWLWADEVISASGTASIDVQVPDTITSWVANGFGLSSVTGIGVSDTTELKVFQPFFIQMTLPYSVIRGEETPIKITVFNYMKDCLPVELTLDATSSEYQVTSYNVKKLCVCGDSGQTVQFSIVPKSLGRIKLNVDALQTKLDNCNSSLTTPGDKVIKELLVEPEGIEQEYTKGTFFCPKNNKFDMVFDLSLPQDIVPGSIYSTFSIIGDVMGPALSNLEGLLRMPYGCGEQNMAKFAPNIYIMDYLTGTNQVTPEIKSKAETFMQSGYQRELLYKRKSGSYSAFGDRDEKGSMMLTAFVVRSFARARKYIFVDATQNIGSISWIRKKQLPNGCFPSYGRVFSRGLQGGVNNELAVSAYVTIALLEAGYTMQDKKLNDSLNCLLRNKTSDHKTYSLALITYAMVLANHSRANEFLTEVQSRAKTEGDMKYWTANDGATPEPPQYGWWYYRPPTADVETTGYIFLSLLNTHVGQNVPQDSLKIVRWLSKQRNSYGGFASTQDTCVALQALANYASRIFSGKNTSDQSSSDLNVALDINNVFQNQITVTKDNKLTLQRVILPADLLPNKLNMKATGGACGLVQATVKYNIPEPQEKPAFDIKANVVSRNNEPDEEPSLCKPLRLKIEAKWLKAEVSNMAVIDVKLVSGFKFLSNSLEMLYNRAGLNFKRYDMEDEGQRALLYFDEIKDISFTVDMRQNENIKNRKPSVIKIYDYYQPEEQAKVMYNVTDDDCYGNKIRDECPKCINAPTMNDVESAVNCDMAVIRVRSKEGKLRIARGYSKAFKAQKLEMYDYQIPEYCFCEEIYDDAAALLVTDNANVDNNGGQKAIMLNARAKIFKWDKKALGKGFKRRGKILKKLKCKNKKQGVTK